MSSNRQWDSLEFNSLDLSYDLMERELSETPRIVAGKNSYVNYGGKLVKRPAVIKVDPTIDTTFTQRIVRLWLYETLDNPSIIYIVASMTNGFGVFSLWYLRMDAGGGPTWTSCGTLRNIDHSTLPHEAVVSRGLLYVKGYPDIGGDKLGTVIFDGTGGTPSLKFWGLLGPTIPAHFSGAIPRINEAATAGISAGAATFHVSAPNSVNLALWTEDLSNAAWATGIGAGTYTATANFATAPDGTTTATKITGTAANAQVVQLVPTVIGDSYLLSFWARSVSGTQDIAVQMQDNTGGNLAVTVITTTTTWTRIKTAAGVATSTTSYIAVGGSSSLNNTQSVLIWGVQCEKTAAITFPPPTTYNRSLGAFGFPAAPFNIQIDSELLTVTAFNTTTGVATVLRGAQGTVAAAHTDQSLVIYRDWVTSAHPGAVNVGWSYTYAYKSLTGQISNRAPVETNPDWPPSNTGAFISLVPKINIQGTADTTNVPTIEIYRTTDGGGTFVLAAEIPNLGAFPISYSDNTLTSTSGTQDPIPDSALNTQSLAPSLTSNSPPTTVTAPKVIGVDLPVASTPIASYAGRLWLGIGNTVFFSANEEINTGIPEECWPSGLYGNFYRFQHPVVNLIGTTDALYVITTQATYQITGTNRETFNPRPILTDIGGAQGHPRAITRYGDAIVWLTSDLRIAVLQGTSFKTISEPIGLDFVNLINTKSAEIDIKYFADLEKEWIVVTAICAAVTSADAIDTRTWVYDIGKSIKLKKDFWNTPWSIPASALLSGRLRESQQQRRLTFAIWSNAAGGSTSTVLTRLAVIPSENVGTDYIPGNSRTVFPFQVRTNLFEVVPGNHINALRRPGVLPVIQHFVAERTVFPGDLDPTATYYLNDLWTSPLNTSYPEDPSRDDQPIGYKTMIYPINTKGRRISLELNKTDTDLFELQNLILTWNSDGGSGI